MTTYTVAYCRPVDTGTFEAVARIAPSDFRLVVDEAGAETGWRGILKDADFAVATYLSRADIESTTRLRLIQCHGVGYDGIDLEAAKELSLPVCVTPAGTVEGVAEHTVMVTLALLRNLFEADRRTREGSWPQWELRSRNRMLRERVVGILGMGRIGNAVAGLLEGFGASVRYFDPHPGATSTTGAQRVSFDELMSGSEVVTVHVPLLDSTRSLVDARALSLMPRDSFLINTSRGEVVDEAALIQALQSGGIGGAALDVFDSEPLPADHAFTRMEQVILTPHNSAGTLDGTVTKMRSAFDNMRRLIDGRELEHRVA